MNFKVPGFAIINKGAFLIFSTEVNIFKISSYKINYIFKRVPINLIRD